MQPGGLCRPAAGGSGAWRAGAPGGYRDAGLAVHAVSNRPAPGVVTAARRGLGRVPGVTGTPRTLWLLLVGLVLLSLVWGAVAAWAVSQRGKVVQDGKRPLSVGCFFGLGHSTIVLDTELTQNIAIRA